MNDGLAQITAAYADGYAEMSGLRDVMQQKTGNYHQSLEDESKRHADEIADIESGTYETQTAKQAKLYSETNEHSKRMKAIWSGLTRTMSDEQKEQLGVFLTLAGQTELYGGQMSEKTETAAKNIVGSFDVLPKDLRKAMGNAMTPMLEEMEKYEPILYAKAQTIAEGVLKKLELGLEEKSPSKATRRIFRYLMLGAEIGMDDETSTLYKQTEDMAKGVVETAEDALGIASPSKVMRDEVGAMIMAGMAKGIKENSKETVDAFKKNLDNIQSLRDFDIINEDQYYERLEKLRDEYFAVGTKEWFDYTLKIYDYQNAIGMVITCDSKKMTDVKCNENGWNHAYVMGFENLGTGRWGGMERIEEGITPMTKDDEIEKNMNGYSETEQMLKNYTANVQGSYSAFESIRKYRDSNKIPDGLNRSPWFVPSIGQWFDMLVNICGKSPRDFRNETSNGLNDTGWGQETLDKLTIQLSKVGNSLPQFSDTYRLGFSCSSQYDKDRCWMLLWHIDDPEYPNWDRVCLQGYDKKAYWNVRPFFAF